MSSNERAILLREIAFLGARPFHHQVVQSPWSPVLDVESFHKSVKAKIREIVSRCREPEAARCLTAHAPAGYGKTHLLAWTRQHLEERGDSLFTYIPPYNPDYGTLEQHVLRSVLDSVRLRSHRQRELMDQGALAFFVQQYDAFVDRGENLKDLQTGSLWQRNFWPSSLKIGKKSREEQRATLQRAFSKPTFLRSAFDHFRKTLELNDLLADNVRPDWDTLVAAYLLTCGDASQREHADRWLRGEGVHADVLDALYITKPCGGVTKILNVLFTLSRLVNFNFCLTFDQMEDVYRALERTGQSGSVLGHLLYDFARQLIGIPRFCLLFMFQQAIWANFSTHAPRMLVDRMIADYGVQELQPLDDATARELVRQRLEVSVWKQLPQYRPPEDNPYFPFAEAEIRTIRIESQSELRGFLQRLQNRYEEMLEGPLQPFARVELTYLEPAEVLSNEATPILIHGRHFPADVEVYFGNQLQYRVACQPEQTRIDITTPTGLKGAIEVRVQDVSDADNKACLTLPFKETEELPRPYRDHIDMSRLRQRRREMKLTQAQVAEKVGLSEANMSKFERGLLKDSADELYLKLAELYERPLRSFKWSGGANGNQ